MHRESLLRIPLVEHLIRDPGAPIVERAVDPEWFYRRILPISSVGFNPFSGCLFASSASEVSKWLRCPETSARMFKQVDRLVSEVLFLVHDYLHLWTFSELLEHSVGKRHGDLVLTPTVISELSFLYVLSETVATVGLDFWYLSRQTLNDICPIDTAVAGITTPYRESEIERYRRCNREFTVQDPSFFDWLLQSYCSGTFVGFSADDLRGDASLLTWLGHELRMGEKARRFIHIWLSYVSGMSLAPLQQISLQSPARRQMTDLIRDKLWAIVQGNDRCTIVPYSLRLVSETGEEPRVVDFRFTNLRHLCEPQKPLSLDWKTHNKEQRTFLSSQYIASFESRPGDECLSNAVHGIVDLGDTAALHNLMRGRKPVEGEPGPIQLAFPN